MGMDSPKVDITNIVGEFDFGHGEVWKVVVLDLDANLVILENTKNKHRIERKADSQNINYYV